jgi:O-antigen biosynthesis protein WbqP
MIKRMIKRLFDFLLSIILLIILSLPMLMMAVAIKLSSVGPVLFWSDRIGLQNKVFRMPKFRTMKIGTPNVATHLLSNPVSHRTGIGSFLRKYSLDELPQLISILLGAMSFVGPRPALFNQADLIELRTQKGIHNLLPGLTGWAQINGRDEIPLVKKIEFDYEYSLRQSFWYDMKILWITFKKVISKSGVAH